MSDKICNGLLYDLLNVNIEGQKIISPDISITLPEPVVNETFDQYTERLKNTLTDAIFSSFFSAFDFVELVKKNCVDKLDIVCFASFVKSCKVVADNTSITSFDNRASFYKFQKYLEIHIGFNLNLTEFIDNIYTHIKGVKTDDINAQKLLNCILSIIEIIRQIHPKQKKRNLSSSINNSICFTEKSDKIDFSIAVKTNNDNIAEYRKNNNTQIYNLIGKIHDICEISEFNANNSGKLGQAKYDSFIILPTPDILVIVTAKHFPVNCFYLPTPEESFCFDNYIHYSGIQMRFNNSALQSISILFKTGGVIKKLSVSTHSTLTLMCSPDGWIEI